MKQKLTFLIFLISTSLNAQKFDKVDHYVKSLDIDSTLSIGEAVKRLTETFSNDLSKARAIYCWIANNIEYDYAREKSNFWTNYTSNDSILLDTFKFRKGICNGYSHLFKYMLNLCDIECEVVSGYARKDLETILQYESTHDWNTVKIDNIWYLFDVTWARDTVKKRVDYFYFQTDPDVFIINHYPLDYGWALLDKFYSLDDYKKFPVYTNLFYDFDFSSEISKIGHYIALEDTVTIKIKPNFDCVLQTKLFDIINKEWIPTREGEFFQGVDYFKLYIPRKGDYILTLGALQSTDSGFIKYDRLIYYTIENK